MLTFNYGNNASKNLKKIVEFGFCGNSIKSGKQSEEENIHIQKKIYTENLKIKRRKSLFL